MEIKIAMSKLEHVLFKQLNSKCVKFENMVISKELTNDTVLIAQQIFHRKVKYFYEGEPERFINVCGKYGRYLEVNFVTKSSEARPSVDQIAADIVDHLVSCNRYSLITKDYKVFGYRTIHLLDKTTISSFIFASPFDCHTIRPSVLVDSINTLRQLYIENKLLHSLDIQTKIDESIKSIKSSKELATIERNSKNWFKEIKQTGVFDLGKIEDIADLVPTLFNQEIFVDIITNECSSIGISVFKNASGKWYCFVVTASSINVTKLNRQLYKPTEKAEDSSDSNDNFEDDISVQPKKPESLLQQKPKSKINTKLKIDMNEAIDFK